MPLLDEVIGGIVQKIQAYIPHVNAPSAAKDLVEVGKEPEVNGPKNPYWPSFKAWKLALLDGDKVIASWIPENLVGGDVYECVGEEWY